jgi:hypothetical protein
MATQPNTEKGTEMTINATREYWESLTDRKRPRRVRTRREIRRGRYHETGR